MPIYPGTKPPVFAKESSIDGAGFVEKLITLNSHTGTHIDAPAHIIKGSKTLDKFPVNHFVGKAFLLNIVHLKNRTVTVDDLAPHQNTIINTDFLLLHTGWSKHWGTEKYFSNYPLLSLAAADWLSRFELKGVGFDTISADRENSQDFLIHKALLMHEIIIIENLTNFENLPCQKFDFSCLPLNIENADGSPVRAVALVQ